MNVQELKPFECIQLTEGTGGSKMHVIKGDNDEIFITCDTKVNRLNSHESNENNQYVYNHFSKENGGKRNCLRKSFLFDKYKNPLRGDFRCIKMVPTTSE